MSIAADNSDPWKDFSLSKLSKSELVPFDKNPAVMLAKARTAIDPKYKPNQQPPFTKRNNVLACAVICKFFKDINQYYGFKPSDWSAPSISSTSLTQ